MSEQQIRELEIELNSVSETARVAGCSKNKAWLWRRGIGRFSPKQMKAVEGFLLRRLKERLSRFGEIAG